MCLQNSMISSLRFTSYHIAANSNWSSHQSSPAHYPFARTILKNQKPCFALSSNAPPFHQNPSLSSEPTAENNIIIEQQNEPENPEPSVRMPTAPWMKGPLLLPPSEVLDLSHPHRNKKKWTRTNRTQNPDRLLTDRAPGRMGEKAMKTIIKRIERLRGTSGFEVESQNSYPTGRELVIDQLEKAANAKQGERRLPWVQSYRPVVFGRMKKEKVPTAAELRLDADLLRKLREEARTLRNWVKVNKAGVTEAVVDEVHSVWSKDELVMLKFRLPLCRNMDRAREIVELKTGGLVVWCNKDTLVAYRGCDYIRNRCLQRITSPELCTNRQALDPENGSASCETEEAMGQEEDSSIGKHGPLMGGEFGHLSSVDRSLYEREGDRILDGLGPRFVDWWYPKPLPVDGDLLPEIVPGFTPPFRLAPPKIGPKLHDRELTYLRKHALHLPTHFVLGRNSRLQGLAVSIVKLWEKSKIAKIAIKWGALNTNHKLMAAELKRLTGGVLILCNKFYIILYRGKDFLPGNLASLVSEREMELRQWQLYEEEMRLKAIENLNTSSEDVSATTSVVGTLPEYEYIQESSGVSLEGENTAELQLLAEKQRLEKEIRTQEHKLLLLRKKIAKSSRELSKLESGWKSSYEEFDQEMMTEEERECLKKIALSNHRVLVLGRRGVFGGVIEGIHQHWKHREIAKVITKQKAYSQVILTARQLERESGGTLVSIDKMREGHAIIMYRGKNYRRPIMAGSNLLSKRKALQRSLELQRVGSLKFFAYQREKALADLKLELVDLMSRMEETDDRES